jgi:3-phenylpropionate/trans-cinnamate dioxygenase ferredoxin reductase subunit
MPAARPPPVAPVRSHRPDRADRRRAPAPYQRPPLSKAWLKGEADADSLQLKPSSWYEEAGVSTCAWAAWWSRSIAGAKTVTLASGEHLAYDSLILATGARARALPIPGADLDGVLALRTAADAEALKAASGRARRLAVVGGGYVGLEAAASTMALGAEVTIIEREPRVLARVACETLSDFFQDYHERARRDLRARRQRGRPSSARTAMSPACGWSTAGDRLRRGPGRGRRPSPTTSWPATPGWRPAPTAWWSTSTARTADPFVFAIGDVAHRPLPIYDRMFRLESVPNALEQAKQAAAAIAGRPRPAGEVPWFWSDQYDLKLQIAGLPFDADRQVLCAAIRRPPSSPSST